MSARVMVADRYGKLLAELEGTLSSVYWRLNKVGEASLLMSRRDAKLIEKNVRPGNRAIIKFDNGLPDFGGVMDLPRDWSVSDVGLTIYSAEHLLRYASTGKSKSFVESTGGAIARNLVIEGNQAFELGIRIGDVYAGGMEHNLDFHYKNVLSIIRDDICGKLSTFDFDVLPVLDRGRIEFVFNFYEHKGVIEPVASLISGANLADEGLKEQGPIINHVQGAGDGTVWDETRPTAEKDDADSVARFGRRAGSIMFTGLSSQTSVAEATQTAVKENKDPKQVATIKATNVGPYTFADYDVGDSIRVIMPKMGFGGFDQNLRLIGREFMPEEKVCNLTVE